MDLTVEQIKAICFRWGTEDARSGGPILNALTGVYCDEYRRGYESAGQENVSEPNTEARRP